MIEIYETYVDFLDVRFRSNTLVVLLISLCIIVVGLISPRNVDLTYNTHSLESQVSYNVN